jgi:CRP-like cAMP-binding protein
MVAKMATPSAKQPRLATPLTRKLSRSVSLSAAEVVVLRDVQSPRRFVGHNREIIAKGGEYDRLLVLLEGVSVRYRIPHDEGRRVLNITLPGDFVGLPGCFFENALYSISALTDCVLPAIPFAQLLGFFETYPRLAAVIFRTFSSEAAMYAEHLIDIGRRQLEENQAASREHTSALRRNWAVRCDSSFAEISPPPRAGLVSTPADRQSAGWKPSITSTACGGPLTSAGSILRVAHSFS